MIKAVNLSRDGKASLGLCRVQVNVAGTAKWLPARKTLVTEIVETVVSLAFVDIPSSIKVGDSVSGAVQLTHRDTSVDNTFKVYISGCGGGADGWADENRRVPFTWTVTEESLAGYPIVDGKCTLSASTAQGGTFHAVGDDRIEARIRVEGH
jgi:hypothetical protein